MVGAGMCRPGIVVDISPADLVVPDWMLAGAAIAADAGVPRAMSLATANYEWLLSRS
jgi:hypothetical protein